LGSSSFFFVLKAFESPFTRTINLWSPEGCCLHIYIYIHVYTCIMYTYIYIMYDYLYIYIHVYMNIYIYTVCTYSNNSWLAKHSRCWFLWGVTALGHSAKLSDMVWPSQFMVPALDDGNMYREPLWLPLNSSVHFPVNHDWMEHLPEWGYGVFLVFHL
jgi:hypothetical protein